MSTNTTVKARQYYVRRAETDNGPWSVDEVRRFLLTSGDPNPDYEVQDVDSGAWMRASEIPELSSMFDRTTTLKSTKGDSPSGKIRVRRT